MRTLMALSLLALTACASAPDREASEAQAAAREEAIQDILTKPLAAEDYVESERCLSTHIYRSVEVLDDRNVLFKGPGDRVWINQLRHRCIGLRRNDTLQFELRDNRVCDLDSFQAVDTLFRVWSRTSATCTLGKFQPVTPEQVEAIRAAVREERKSP